MRWEEGESSSRSPCMLALMFPPWSPIISLGQGKKGLAAVHITALPHSPDGNICDDAWGPLDALRFLFFYYLNVYHSVAPGRQ